MYQKIKDSLYLVIKWLFIPLVSAVIGTSTYQIFNFLLKHIAFYLWNTQIPLPIWSAVGALIAGLVIYKIQPRAAGEGIPSYIFGLRRKVGNLDGSVTFYKFWAALTTLATFGNGGIVGPLGRVSAGIMSVITRRIFKIHRKQTWQLASICGLASIVGTVFHSSIGGGIFAVEIINRDKMKYIDIFPAIVASAASVYISKALGWATFYTIPDVDEFLEVDMLVPLLILVICAGTGGKLYVKLYSILAKFFERHKQTSIWGLLIGSVIAAVIGWLINPEIMGTSTSLIPSIIHNDKTLLAGHLPLLLPISLILLILAIVKGVCNCLTVGSGMSAGFTGPAIIIGMLLGASAANIFSIAEGTATYYAFIAAGFCGVLASSMNIPLAAAIITIEVFGLQASFPASMAAIVGFLINRDRTIYDYALQQNYDLLSSNLAK